MIHPIIYCNFEGAKWLLFGPNVPNIIYYSHIPNIIIAFLLGLFILFQNRKNLSNKVLFYTILAYETWVFSALVFWATNRSDIVMFSWLMDIVVEPLVYIGALYLLYVLIDKQDLSFRKKLFLAVLYLPVALFLPTKLMLSSFDVGTCLAIEGPLALYYTYFVEISVTVWAIWFSVDRYVRAKSSEVKKEILILGIGTILLLFAFAWGNIIGSFSDNWQLGDYGLFGMPVFIGFLTYSIVKFKAFDIKLLGAQALVWSLVALIGSQFFYLSDAGISVQILTAITLIISSLLGLILVRSVKREVSLREQLENANAGQENIIHVMNHQIKGHLGIMKNIFAELLTDDYGVIPEGMQPLLKRGLGEANSGVVFVTEILKGASAQNGTLQYDMHQVDFQKLITPITLKEKEIAEKKGLVFDFVVDGGDYTMQADTNYLTEAIRNLIENSINYTPKGKVNVHLSRQSKSLLLSIIDTGVGVREEDKNRLFKAGGTARDSIKINTKSSGYGLVFVKGVIESHKGRVWFESAGEGKGTTFFVELPIV